MTRERAIGLALLIFFVFLCLVLSVGLDAGIFVPHQTARAITLTGPRGTPVRVTRQPPRSTVEPTVGTLAPQATETPRVIDQSARYVGDPDKSRR